MKSFTIEAVVIGESNVGENDKIITVLTPDRGQIRITAKGARSLKSGRLASTMLFCYSEMQIEARGAFFHLKEAQIKRSFYGIRDSMEGFSLACYLAEACREFATEEDNQSELMRLLLNCFHLIEEGKVASDLIKAVFEMRTCRLSGLAPSLDGCSVCGSRSKDGYFLDISQGGLVCDECAAELSETPDHERVFLSTPVLLALVHIVYSPEKKIFSFKLDQAYERELVSVCEKYFIFRFEKKLPSLDYYRKMTADPIEKKIAEG